MEEKFTHFRITQRQYSLEETYPEIFEMTVLMSCKSASESNLSRFLHVFSRRKRASNSAGDFFNWCCNYRQFYKCLEETCSNAGCITVEANFRPSGDFSDDFCGVEFRLSVFRESFSEVLWERDTVRMVVLSGFILGWES